LDVKRPLLEMAAEQLKVEAASLSLGGDGLVAEGYVPWA
jgi:hypothetical protein